MDPPSALLRGGAFGVAVALTFALVIRLVPEAAFEPKSGWLVLVYVVGALAAPPSVWMVGLATRQAGRNRRLPVVAAGLGAMAFDGLAIGFVPGLYGQSEMGSVGGGLLWAFFSLGVAGVVMTGAHRA